MIQAIPQHLIFNKFILLDLILLDLDTSKPHLELQGVVIVKTARFTGQLSEEPEKWAAIYRGMKRIDSQVGNTGKGQLGVVGAIEPSVCFQLQWRDNGAEVQ